MPADSGGGAHGSLTTSAQARTGSPNRCLASRYISSEDAARVRIPDSGWGVGVPREGGTARATAGLVLRAIRTDGGIVGLLGLPGDDPVADVDLPGAGTGAVHTVGGPHHLVVAPAIAVEDIASATAFAKGHPTVVGLLPSGEKLAEFQQRIRCFAIDPGRDRSDS